MDHLPPRKKKKMQDGHRKEIQTKQFEGGAGRANHETINKPTPNAWGWNRHLRSKENLIEKSHQDQL